MLQISVIEGIEGGTFICMDLDARREGEGGTSDSGISFSVRCVGHRFVKSSSIIRIYPPCNCCCYACRILFLLRGLLTGAHSAKKVRERKLCCGRLEQRYYSGSSLSLASTAPHEAAHCVVIDYVFRINV